MKTATLANHWHALHNTRLTSAAVECIQSDHSMRSVRRGLSTGGQQVEHLTNGSTNAFYEWNAFVKWGSIWHSFVAVFTVFTGFRKVHIFGIIALLRICVKRRHSRFYLDKNTAWVFCNCATTKIICLSLKWWVTLSWFNSQWDKFIMRPTVWERYRRTGERAEGGRERETSICNHLLAEIDGPLLFASSSAKKAMKAKQGLACLR